MLFHPFFGTGHQIVNLFEASDPFRKLLYHPTIVGAVQQLMGTKELYVWHDQLLSKPPHTGEALHYHQDAPLWPILDPAQSHSMVSAWVTFDSVDATNGALQMVPGSYRHGNRMCEIGEIRETAAKTELGLSDLQLRAWSSLG